MTLYWELVSSLTLAKWFCFLWNNKNTHQIRVTDCWLPSLNMYKPVFLNIPRCILSKQRITQLIPNGIPLIPFSYLSSEQKCLSRSVSSAVWDGIRPDFSIYPPSFSILYIPHPPLISCSHFMMTGNPAGLEGRHLSSHSQEGIFLLFFFQSNMWRLWFKCTSKELWSFPRLPSLSQIKTMTVESVNRQMYDNHFPQAHYCGAHGRGTGFIIMPQPLLQLSRFSPILSLLQRWGIFMRLLGQVSHVDIRHASTW